MEAVRSTINNQIIVKHKEGYKEQDEDKGYVRRFYIDNLLHVSKLKYQAEWFNSCIKYKKESVSIVLSDRSPMDTVSYIEEKQIYLRLVETYFKEMSAHFGIEFKFIYLRVSPEIMLSRISKRLLREAWRKNYHEAEDEVMLGTRNFFENNLQKWDLVLDANRSVEDVSTDLYNYISENTS